MTTTLHPGADSFDPRQHDRQVDRPCCPISRPDRSWQFQPEGWSDAEGRSPLQVILIGSAEAVNREILNLYPSGYALDGWSLPQVVPGSNQVISMILKAD